MGSPRKINAEKYVRESQQAETLSDLEQHSYELLHDELVVVSADTIIYEHYRNVNNARIWLEGLHWEWLNANMELCSKSSGSVYYRYIVLPYPYVLQNTTQRKRLIDSIILNVHLHLWHGVICAIKFLDPRIHSINQLTREMNFFIIPEAEEFFGLPAYYRSNTIEQVRVVGSEYVRQQQLVKQWASMEDSDLVWLFYDEAHFERKRLSGWHWSQLRRFFFQLNAEILICPLCRTRQCTELDHIAPCSRGYFQTLLNFELLCGECNRYKSNIESVDPFAFHTLIEPRLQSKALEQVLREPPPWLGRIRRPKTATYHFTKKIGLQ
jgi:hypothetical protein